MGIFRRTMQDDAKEFYGDLYATAQLLIHQYLAAYFKHAFSSTTEYPARFHLAASAQVGSYLLGRNMDDFSGVAPEVRADVELARQHAAQWATQVMNGDPEFAHLVMQTLRLHFTYQEYLSGKDRFYGTQEAEDLLAILAEYGQLDPQQPTPASYRTLIKQWLQSARRLDPAVYQ